ncbi:MAG: M1 family metallopeptidase [Alphaproteobacteria bacterium]|nr:M1 family metallopeptidase [Alphaproteobacteria bacterium]
MKRVLPVVFLALTAVLAGCGKSGKEARPAWISENLPLGRLPQVAVPSRYRLSFTIDPRKNGFTGHDEIDVTFAKPRRTLFLHGRRLTVSGVEVRLASGRIITAHYDQVDRSGIARLVFVDEVPRGPATLIFDYDAKFDRSLSGLYKVVDRGVSYAFTQFEAADARRAFPSFDEPGFKTPFEVTVTAPAGDSVITNSEETSVTPVLGGMKRIVFAATKPLPTYLVAVAVGPFDIVDGGVIAPDQVRSRAVRLRGITAKGEGDRIRLALSWTPKIVRALESYFGVAYPYSKLDMLAVPDFAAGAMENAGAITFRERLLLFDAKAPLEQKRSSLLTQAHELTHQWFGDLVTPQWWDDIWLNESFANWMEVKAAASVMPDWQFDTETLRSGFDVMATDELASTRQIHQPVRTQDDISDAFDGITYDKGASVLAMFENYLGPDVWRAGIHTYLTKYAFGTAKAKDFVDTIAHAAQSKPRNLTITVDKNENIFWNGEKLANQSELKQRMVESINQSSADNIARAFDTYLNQTGIPLLHVAAQCGQGNSHLDVAQAPYTPIGQRATARLWDVPVCLEDTHNTKSCWLMGGQSAVIPLTQRCAWPLMPNANGKGYYRFAFDEKGWPDVIAAAKLSPADQITLLENVMAGVRADDASAGYLIGIIRALAPAARWDVIDRISVILHRLRETTGGDLADYRAFVRMNFGYRLKAVGLAMKPKEKPATTLEREKLVHLALAEGADPVLTAELSAAAHSYVAAAGQKAEALAPDLLGDALRAGLVADPPFADALTRAYEASDDEYFRRSVIYAFSGSGDPAVIGKLLAMAPRMRGGELRYLYQFMAAEPTARTVLWNWFKANYGAMVARSGTRGLSRGVSILSNACDKGSRDAVETFFRPKTDVLEGSARPLALVEERIEGCIAFKAAKDPEIAAALQSQR